MKHRRRDAFELTFQWSEVVQDSRVDEHALSRDFNKELRVGQIGEDLSRQPPGRTYAVPRQANEAASVPAGDPGHRETEHGIALEALAQNADGFVVGFNRAQDKEERNPVADRPLPTPH